MEENPSKSTNLKRNASEGEPLTFSQPTDFQHLVHVTSNFQWIFDSTQNPKETFQKIRLIGEGGFGKVYQILHIPSGTYLAGKVIQPSLLTKRLAQNLKKELDIMKDIRCPYVVRICGYLNFEEKLMILLEYCDHGSLRDIMDFTQKPFTEPQISFILKDILIALTVLHTKHKTLHRDIKSGNILMNKKGEIKLTDFGISRKFGPDDIMVSHSICGSPYWISPEVLKGGDNGAKADIWSLGVTMIELAEFHPPFYELDPRQAMKNIRKNGFQGYRMLIQMILKISFRSVWRLI